MQGIILGFDSTAGAGVVRGDDGKRYKFLQKDWRSNGLPKAQDTVDFEPGGESAAEVFMLKRNASIDMTALSEGAAKLSASAAQNAAKITGQLKANLADEDKRKELANAVLTSRATQLVLQRPSLVLGVLIILGCFAPFVSSFGQSFSLWSVMGFVSDAIASINQMGALMAMMSQKAGSSGGSLFLMKMAPRSLYLLYAIPVFAGILVVKELTGKAGTRQRVWAGLAGLLSPVVAGLLATLFGYLAIPDGFRDSMGAQPNPSFAQAFGGISFNVTDYLGWGIYLVWIASALLLLIAVGVLKPSSFVRRSE